MNHPARVTITFTDLSQNNYVVESHDDVLEVYRLLDAINKKQNAARHARLQRGTGVDLKL